MIEVISCEETHPLRKSVLRGPGTTATDLEWPGDRGPRTRHLGSFVDGRLVAVATIIEEAEPKDRGGAPGWRVRGMATAPEARGGGHGGQLLEGLVAHARAHDARVVWCHARIKARAFYERHAFVVVGEPYDLPGIGPHVYMRRAK